jgi:hypothetical protein
MPETGAPDGESEGEEVTISVTEDTVIRRVSMGGGMQGAGDPGAGGSGNGNMEMPDKPDGEASNGGSGEADVPEKPDGETQNGGTGETDVPEKPDGEAEDMSASDKPDGEALDGDSGNGQTDVPEKPDGEASDNGSGETEVPEKPDGEALDSGAGDPGTGNAMGGMQDEEITLADIEEGDMVTIVLDEDGNAASIEVQSGSMQMQGGGPGGSEQPDEYTAVQTYSEDTSVEGEEISSTGTDENAILVDDGASVTLDQVTVSRDSADSTGGDSSSFYGVGAAVLAADGAAYVANSTITTDAAGGAGIFAYGDGTVYAEDSTITTEQNTSGGIHAAGGGTLYAWDLDVSTNGESAAAIRSDRGGGTMVVNGGTYVSNGIGSPAVYCTADIAVNAADLVANGSEAVCLEGLNTLHLFDCNLTGNMSDDSQNDCTWTVIVYQSMSGDSEVGNGTFSMDGGTLTSGNGGLFYTTNTECTFTLKDVEIIPSETNAFFLRCTGNANQRGWGTTGANGSDCLFTAISQEMTGDIIWDSISQLDLYITQGSSLTGAVVDDETFAGEGGNGYANVVIDADSTWTVTGDSVLTSLACEGTIVDADGNTVSVVGTDGTEYVQGDSAYTITVESYSDQADTSGASEMVSWEDYEVERPEI